MTRVIQFSLPSGSGGMAAGMRTAQIKKQLDRLHIQYKTTYEKDYKMNIWLENENEIEEVLQLLKQEKHFKEPIIVIK